MSITCLGAHRCSAYADKVFNIETFEGLKARLIDRILPHIDLIAICILPAVSFGVSCTI